MLHITRWSPDTCDCVIEYQWDDTVPQGERVHTPVNVYHCCWAHSATPTAPGLFSVLMDENPRKNKTLSEIASRFTELADQQPDGSYTLKQGVVSWHFNESRVLEVTIPSLTALKKAQLQTAVDTKFGVGKILII